jgi:hypothetical protein
MSYISVMFLGLNALGFAFARLVTTAESAVGHSVRTSWPGALKLQIQVHYNV